MKISTFTVPRFALQKGGVLPDTKLVYATLGELSPKRDNVVVVPVCFAGTHEDMAAMFVGEGRPLDPSKYFIVIPNLLGGGVSSSPSNTPAPFNGPCFPRVTLNDNIRLQQQMLEKVFDISSIRLVTGWSMGGCQTFQWACQFPEMVRAAVPFAAAARTGVFNRLFLLSLVRCLKLDPAFADGCYQLPPVNGLKAFAANYAGWGFSEEFYRNECYRKLNCNSLDEFVECFWETLFLQFDANDLLAQIWAWEHSDVSDNSAYNNDLSKALSSVKARMIVVPGSHDSYFTAVDNAGFAALIPGAEYNPIDSTWGHMFPFNPIDAEEMDRVLRNILGAE